MVMTGDTSSGSERNCLPDPRLQACVSDEGGIGGRFRVHNDEFVVEEMELFPPSGQGEHLYLRIEKEGISHRDMISRLIKAYQLPEAAIGYAGMKDRRAITEQTVSVHTDRTDVPAFSEPGLKVLWAERHDHKLRRGQLVGNRFSIRIREVDPLDGPRAWKTLDKLATSGLPNAYMSQRFGYRLNNHRLGAAWLSGKWTDLLDEWLGSSGSPYPPSEASVRSDYDAGRYQQAVAASSREWWAERAALEALAGGASPARACSAVPSVIRSLWIDAAQASIFNRLLAQRMTDGTMDRLLDDDIAWDHGRGRWFRTPAENLHSTDMLNAIRDIDVSPTGPLPGRRMPSPGASVDAMERQAAQNAGIDWDQMVEGGGGRRGGRRPLRVPIQNHALDAGVDERGNYIRIDFELPKGAYATGVLAEIMGADAIEERGWLNSVEQAGS
ncbi:MAG: tRNA pseudouridine(13) synthase TruD [Planctomycetota bacterium]|nr:tRNA pseudouridine(13) synthase TruD [Planctomycetota bacterium]